MLWWQSNFEELFAPDGEAQTAWAPFVDIELQAQEQLMQHLLDERSSSEPNQHCFSRVDARLRDKFKKVSEAAGQ